MFIKVFEKIQGLEFDDRIDAEGFGNALNIFRRSRCLCYVLHYSRSPFSHLV